MLYVLSFFNMLPLSQRDKNNNRLPPKLANKNVIRIIRQMITDDKQMIILNVCFTCYKKNS